METTYEIAEDNFNGFKKSFKKLQKKAIKLSVGKPSFEIIREELFEDDGGFCKIYFVSVSGFSPRIAGWSFAASLEYTPNGNIIKSIQGFDCPQRYHHSHQCEHCNTDRYRKKTFIIKNESGKTMQVGSSCLRDFLGHAAPDQIAAYWQAIGDLIHYISTGERQANYYNVRDILRIGSAAIKKYGFVSKKAFYDSYGKKTPSVENVNAYFAAKKARQTPPFATAKSDSEKADCVINWVKTKTDSPDSNYFHNLNVIVKNEIVGCENFAILISAIAYYDREQEKLAIKKNNPSNHFGEIKKRYTLNLKIVSRKTWAHGYDGTGEIIKFIDENENGFVWFSSKMFFVEHNDFFECRATIKNHPEYNGRKETILTRVSLNK